MPQRKVVTAGSREPRRRFAEELRRLRLDRGESLRALGERMGWDSSLLGKMENGDTLGGPEVVQALDHYYGTPGLLLALWELARADHSAFRQQYRRYVKLEAEATGMWHFGVSVLPGLLQTRGYAREVLASGGLVDEELDRQVKARISRQELLCNDDAPSFRAIIWEAVLRVGLTDPGEWQSQVQHLVTTSEQPHVVLQVLPFAAGPCGLDSTAVMFLRLPDGSTVAYTENAYRGELIEEAASLNRMQRAYDAARDRALTPAESRKFILGLMEEAPCDAST